MSDFPSLTEVLAEHRWRTGYVEGRGIVSSCSRSCGWSQDVVNSHRTSVQLHDRHVAAAWHEACTITTPEQAAALPAQAVVRNESFGMVLEKDVDSCGEDIWCAGRERTYKLLLPALLIWNPEWSQP